MIKQLVGKAPPPAGLISVATDYPEILADENGPDQKAPQAWSTQGRSESLGGEGGRPFVSQQAFAADQWVYKDPQGVTQGPFTRVEILDWHSAGFFPNELPVKAASDPDSHFLPLSTMVKMWERVDLGSAPPGFAPPLPAKSQPQTHPQPGLQLQTGFDSSSSITLGLMSPGQAQQSQRASTLLNPFDNVLANIPDSLDPHGQSFAPPPSVTGLWSSPLNPPQAPSSFQAQGHTLNAWLPSVPNAQGLSHQLHGPSAVQSQGMDQALFGQPPPSNTHNPWVTHPPSQDPVISNSWTPSIGQPGFTSFGQAPPTPALSAWGQPSGVHLMPNTQHEQQKEASHKPEPFAPGPTVNASMPAPLQQLFAAAQRAGQQQQEHQKALEQQQHQQRLQQEHQQQQHKHQVQQQQRQECLIFSSEQDRLLHSSSTDDAPLKPAEPKFAPWAAASAKGE